MGTLVQRFGVVDINRIDRKRDGHSGASLPGAFHRARPAAHRRDDCPSRWCSRPDVKALLDHVNGDVTEVYDKYDMLKEKRQVVELLASELRRIIGGAPTQLAERRRAAAA
ncbi:hypothetical protein [Bradyrhizobium sp. RDM4]|uniref:hypothetical protein n=1 Tax=Bradyrhizobium sp. RDM4 TaxID=3378765 RepID=UPI0038FCCDC1